MTIIIRKASIKESITQMSVRYELNGYKSAKPSISKSQNGKNRFTYIAIDSTNNKIVGSCGFSADSSFFTKHRAHIGYATTPEYRRQGISSKLIQATIKEAKKLHFRRLEAEISVGNTASIKLIKKCGFKLEGRRTCGAILENGSYVDTFLFGKLLK